MKPTLQTRIQESRLAQSVSLPTGVLARVSPFLILASAVLILMWPRLASASFGLFDDGVMIQICREMRRSLSASGRVLSDTGRFLPAYYLYNYAVYLIGWASPLIFYLANALALLFVSLSLFWFTRYRGGTPLQATTAGVFFIFSGPSLEAFYTLSKPEVPVSVFLALALLCFPLFERASKRLPFILVPALVFVLILADGSKEVSIAMVPIAAGWLVMTRLKAIDENDRFSRFEAGCLLFASISAAITIFVMRNAAGVSSVSSGSYTSAYALRLDTIIESARAWIGLILRAFPHVVVLAASLVWATQRPGMRRNARFLIDSVIWMVLWLAIYLPWKTSLEYYLVPFAMGCSIFGGLLFGHLWERFNIHRHSTVAVMVLTASLFAITIVNNFTNGRYQILMDTANSEMLERLASLPRDSTVLVNMPEPSEYVYEIGLHLAEFHGRPDIEVGYFRFDTAHTRPGVSSYYVASPMVRNQLFPSVRYPVFEGNTTGWNAALNSFVGPRQTESMFSVQRQMHSLDIGLQYAAILLGSRRFCCLFPRPLVDTRTLRYGWTLHHIRNDPQRSAWPAQFLSDGTWKFYGPGGFVHAVQFGQPGDVPIRGDWNGDGFTDIGIFRPSDLTWRLDATLDGRPEYFFRVPGMQRGDLPLAGDWDGDGRDTPGFFRPATANWTVTYDLHGRLTPRVFGYGSPGDSPLAGDWDGDGQDTVAIYRPGTGEFHFQNSLSPGKVLGFALGRHATPIVGDWAGHGIDTPATVTADSTLRIRAANCNCLLVNQPPEVPLQLLKGQILEGQILAGKWALPGSR